MSPEVAEALARGSICIDPNTAQGSIVSDPFPTLVGGIPIRLRSVDVEVNRPEFTFNPTDCNSQAVTGTVTAAQGASAAVSSPFAVTGCANLPFKPVFTGDNVTIDLTGGTDIKKGFTYSTFESVPDAPITSFESKFPEGPDAIFGTDLPAKTKAASADALR